MSIVSVSPLNTSFQNALDAVSSLRSRDRCAVSGLLGSSISFFISSLFSKNSSLKAILVITAAQGDAENLTADINFFLGQGAALLYPSWEVLPFEAQLPHPEIIAARINVLHKLSQGEPVIIIATPNAVMQRVMPKAAFNRPSGGIVRFETGREAKRDAILQQLMDMGYSRVAMVQERGEIRVAGGIVDIFPPSYSTPVRIEFFGDDVETIRTFDIDSQRSKETLNAVSVLPVRELDLSKQARDAAISRIRERSDELETPRDLRESVLDKIRGGMVFGGMDFLLPLFYDKLDTFFNYFTDDCLIFLDKQDETYAAAKEFENEVSTGAAKIREKRQLLVRAEELYMPLKEFNAAVASKAVVDIGGPAGHGFECATESNLDIRQDISVKKEDMLKPLADRINAWRGNGWGVFIVCHNAGQAERLKDMLEGYGLEFGADSGSGKGVSIILSPASSSMITVGSLSSGFRFPSVKLAVITEEDIFGQRTVARPPSTHKINAFLTHLQDLNMGDSVVHTIHGIGLYQGLKRLKIEDIENDFLLLEYNGGDKLYLPVQRLNLISKYHGATGKKPGLDKLGSTNWEKTKGRVKKAVEEMAKELLELYASRKVVEGFSFSKGSRLFSEFEASFEYDETPDQLRAIEEVLKDMEDTKPMDRLVCGDVGYGKTEVAMRAAFKAVMDGKQTAVLVPTTILAQQHYSTFKNRFAAYPVAVDMLSRFRSAREQKETVKKLANGEVDIIIGTHRLLQKDIVFKDLGLIVVDEEHRFGVSHKERLKQIRKQVDVLTLTATPIPRTLHMSLSGVRDLSIINTPPVDRLAIKTVVARFDDELIQEAVRRELARSGQIFFVHNRVQSIWAMADYLKRIVQEARVGVAHGQMKENELEKVMAAFINREYDILLSTSIIESGLDIPSANTIIINRADRFGLAEIYQLRGRVGRSSHRAYAYLLTPPELTLAADAKKRLNVLQELSDLGAGFRLAAYDLEIRGAGEMLGHSQSGQIAEVGFEMYTQLLEEAIKELKGEKVEEEIEPEINLRVSAYIPEAYIPDEKTRLNIYKRIATVSSENEMDNLKEELTDRFGEVPELINNLFRIMGLKLILKRLKITDLSQRGEYVYMKFSNKTPVTPERLLLFIKKQPRKFRILPDSRFVALLEKRDDTWGEIRYILQQMMTG